MKNAINWLITWAGFSLLKKSLHNRLKGPGASWLQPIQTEAQLFNRVDFIIDFCRGKRVLHIGFTDHPFTRERIVSADLLHLHLQKITTSLAGVDVEPAAVKEYQALTGDSKVWVGDILEAYPTEAIAFKPTVVLLTEVLEHLENPYQAVNVLHAGFETGTTILVTVPNYTALDSFAASLHQTESIHPDHRWYFSPYTLTALFDKKRFKLNQLSFGMYYKPGSPVNAFLKRYPLNGDCIIAVFTII
jgi:hypothetical protein